MAQRTRSDWLALFEAQQGSGLSAAEFCRREGICPSYFSQRKRHFGWQPDGEAEADPDNQAGAGFVELRRPSIAGALQVHWGGVSVSLPAGVSARWVAALMRELSDASVQ